MNWYQDVSDVRHLTIIGAKSLKRKGVEREVEEIAVYKDQSYSFLIFNF